MYSIYTYIFSLKDNDGPYYWHIKSGTIQREVPVLPNAEKLDKSETRNSYSKETDCLVAKFDTGIINTVTRSNTSSALDLEFEDRKRKDDLALK